MQRRLPIGADVQSDGSTHFRVWAPDARSVSVVVDRGDRACEGALIPEGNGYHSRGMQGITAGACYRYRVDGQPLADPASRFQPRGPFGPSEVIDPSAFRWTDGHWPGVSLAGQVLYELHVGTFTPEGTWRSAIERLPLLAETGVTVIEMMPVGDFAGEFGWGYDGVFPFAPTRLYGRPDDLRAFVDRAHALGLGVVLDVVYNHLGPEGCVFNRYARSYYSTRYKGEWGDPLNFDGPDSAAVREYVIANAAHWIAEYRLDGLRFDATQGMYDSSDEHILAAIAAQARAAAAGRSVMLLAENEPQQTRLIRSRADHGYGLDGLWNDDFHHSAVVAATGRREAYYSDHYGAPQELISAVKYGYLFQGQRYAWQKQPRGSSTEGIPPYAFINYLDNHDQVANSGDGSRLRSRTTPGRMRALTALLLLMPGTPMLFQGQEFGATTPFLYFADLSPDLALRVQAGRADFVKQFVSLATPEVQSRLPAPHDAATFERCKLRWTEREERPEWWRLHRDLIALRRSDAAFHDGARGRVDGSVLAPEAFALRYLGDSGDDDRLLLVNLGTDLVRPSIAEPLLAPPSARDWVLHWSSEHPDYGGLGTPQVVGEEGWRVPAHSAVVLRPAEKTHGSARQRED